MLSIRDQDYYSIICDKTVSNRRRVWTSKSNIDRRYRRQRLLIAGLLLGKSKRLLGGAADGCLTDWGRRQLENLQLWVRREA
jgi:hypothetical protein